MTIDLTKTAHLPPDLREVIEKIAEQSTGMEYVSTRPTDIPAGKVSIFDDGTTRLIYFKTGQGTLISVSSIAIVDLASQVNGTLSTVSGGTGVSHKLIDVTTYIGNGTDNRTVTHSLGIQPAMTLVIREDTADGNYVWTPRFPAGYSKNTSDGSMHNDGIKSVDTTTITLGTVAGCNGSGGSFSAISYASQ